MSLWKQGTKHEKELAEPYCPTIEQYMGPMFVAKDKLGRDLPWKQGWIISGTNSYERKIEVVVKEPAEITEVLSIFDDVELWSIREVWLYEPRSTDGTE